MKFLNVKKEDSLCWVYLNRPESMNALNSELLEELTEFNKASRMIYTPKW